MEEVNAYAQRCFDELALLHIEKANEAAMKAELPPPDFSGVMRECWEKKLDLAIRKVRTTNGVARSLEWKSSCNGG
jgi:hypothetical protein